MGVHVWSNPLNKHVLLMGRVMEKSSAYALVCVEEASKLCEIDWTQYETVVFWADGPRQFKSLTWLGTLGFHSFDHPTIKKVFINFGAPHHFKKGLDRLFGETKNATTNATYQRMLEDIDDVVEVAQVYFNDQRLVHPSISEVLVRNFEPIEKEQLKLEKFTGPSVFGLNHSYSFSIQRIDARRKTVRGAGVLGFNVLTGLRLRNHLVAGQKCPLHRTGHDFCFDSRGG